jgi:hypothetical protein
MVPDGAFSRDPKIFSFDNSLPVWGNLNLIFYHVSWSISFRVKVDFKYSVSTNLNEYSYLSGKTLKVLKNSLGLMDYVRHGKIQRREL